MSAAAFVAFAILALAIVPRRPPGDLPVTCACSDLAGENALWLRYTWYFGSYSSGDLRALAERLCRERIRYAYFHVRYIKKDGSLRFHYAARGLALVQALRPRAPGVREIAWIYAGNRRGSGHVDLSNPLVRSQMVEEAAWLVRACHFDGIQWDYEACEDGDPYFLELLRETRARLPAGAILAVAGQVWLPPPHHRWGWSDAYLRRVAALSDQIAVMAYDTGYRTTRRYHWLVAQQVVHLTRAAADANPKCRALVGVPAYGDPGPAHRLNVENMTAAIKGVREGLASPDAVPSHLAGLATFADYSATADDWDAYNHLWLCR